MWISVFVVVLYEMRWKDPFVHFIRYPGSHILLLRITYLRSAASLQDAGGMGGSEEEFQHSAPVVQVESISAFQVKKI